jgi:hypothetical protein
MLADMKNSTTTSPTTPPSTTATTPKSNGQGNRKLMRLLVLVGIMFFISLFGFKANPVKTSNPTDSQEPLLEEKKKVCTASTVLEAVRN